MNEPRYFDIRKVKVGEQNAPSFRQRIQKNLSERKKVLALRWEFLDLSLSGILVYGLVVLLAFGSAILTTRIISANFNKKPELEVAPTFSGFEVEVQNPTAENPSASQKPEAVKDNSPNNNPFEFIKQSDGSTAPAKDSFNIRVLNGNARTGEAAKTKQELSAKGFRVSSIGNAKNRYTQTQIYHLAGKEAEAKLVKENLGREAEIHQADDSLIGAGYDVLIVLGLK